jgi:energy-coupling factor transporter ATP-binding protein EcfA2
MSIKKEELNQYIFNSKEPRSCKTYKLLLHILKKEHLFYISPDFLRFLFQDEILGAKFNSMLWDIPENFGEMNINEKIELFKSQFSELDFSDYLSELDFYTSDFSPILKNFIDISPNGTIETVSFFSEEHFVKSDFELIFQEEKFQNIETERCEFIKDNKVVLASEIFSLLNIKNIFERASIVIIPLTQKSENFFTTSTSVSQNIKPIFLNDMHDIHELLASLQKDLAIEKRDKKIETTFLDSIKVENLYNAKFQMENIGDKKEIYIVGDSGEGKSLLLKAIVSTLKSENPELFSFPKIEIKDTKEQVFKFGEFSKFHRNIFAYGLSRGNSDFSKEDREGYKTLFDDSYSLQNPNGWFKTILFLQNNKKSSDFAQVKNLFIDLIGIDISKSDFETLPSMKRYILNFVADFLSHLSENQPIVTHLSELVGIVIVDEIELRLNPDQKNIFVKKLRKWLPNIQFIFTTFSREMVSHASEDAVFYRLKRDEKEIFLSQQYKKDWATKEFFGK